MAKTKISEYSSTAANNTDVANINIAEGCSPSNINNAIRAVMSHLKNFQDGSSGDSLTIAGALASSGTLTQSGTLAVTGNLTLDGASGTSGQVLLSAGTGATPTWGDAFVTGMIMMWSGTIATIPSGWLLCDGTNSTPDLRNKFIVAANADSGGAAKTTITGTAAQTGGSKDAIVVSHTHTITDPGHDHRYAQPLGGGGGSFIASVAASFTATNNADTSTETTGITVDSAGSSGTNANLPPFYALAFIMKA